MSEETKMKKQITDRTLANTLNKTLTITAVALLIIWTQHPSSANEIAYQKTLKSTVWVLAADMTGTGVLIDRETRLVVTNQHVVSNHDSVEVFFPAVAGGRVVSDPTHYLNSRQSLGIPAKVVARDPLRDIAVLKLDRIPDEAVEIEIGSPGRPGQNIHSIGNPGASDALWIYTFGKVRANYYRKGIYATGPIQMQMLETQSPINPGDSGGPIVNDEGQLIGISQGMSTDSRLYSYGVDISEIEWFVKKFKRNQVASDNVSPRQKLDNNENPNATEFASRTEITSATGQSFQALPFFSMK